MGLRWLFLIGFVLTVAKPFMGPSTLKATVLVDAPTTSVEKTSAGQVHVTGRKADIELSVPQSGDETLRHVVQVSVFPPMLVGCVLGFVLCTLAQKLVRNLAKGQLFSPENAVSLRWFTIVLIAGTIALRMITAWSNHVFAKYAAANLTVAGAHVLPFAENVHIQELQLALGNADVIVVVLLLLILWALKEGASLKQDAELTV